MFVSCGCLPLRLEANTSRLPSRVNIGKPSKSGLNVIAGQPRPVLADGVEVEVAALRIGHVRREDDLPAAAAGRYGAKLAAPFAVTAWSFVPSAFMIADLEGPRRIGVAREVLPVARQVLGRRQGGRPGRRSSCRRRRRRRRRRSPGVGHALHVRAVGVHRVDLEVAVAGGREDDRLAVGRDRGLGVVRRGGEERLDVGAVGFGGVDVVVVERPDVPVRAVRAGRARRARAERRRVEDAVARGKKYEQVVLPSPLETRRRSEPSAFIVKIWSQGSLPSSDWKMSRVPSADQYASAFCPPKVSWRRLARNFSSPGREEGRGLDGGPRASGRSAVAAPAASSAGGHEDDSHRAADVTSGRDSQRFWLHRRRCGLYPRPRLRWIVRDDLKRVLADEIRAADRRDGARAGRRAGRRGSRHGGGARAPCRTRRPRLLTPSVPPGAPLEPVKRLAIRALRFLWRNQSTFNALSMDASSRPRRRARPAPRRDRARLDELARRAGDPGGAPDARSSPARPPAPSGAGRGSGARAARPRFRPASTRSSRSASAAAPSEIAAGSGSTSSCSGDLPGPVLDVGLRARRVSRACSQAEGIAASGVESNPVSVAACRPRGLVGRRGRTRCSFSPARPPGKLGAVVAFQVVEHWPPEGDLPLPAGGAPRARAGRRARRGDDQHGLALGAARLLPRSRRTCAPSRPRPCGSWPRPRVSPTRGSNTGRPCPPAERLEESSTNDAGSSTPCSSARRTTPSSPACRPRLETAPGPRPRGPDSLRATGARSGTSAA